MLKASIDLIWMWREACLTALRNSHLNFIHLIRHKLFREFHPRNKYKPLSGLMVNCPKWTQKTGWHIHQVWEMKVSFSNLIPKWRFGLFYACVRLLLSKNCKSITNTPRFNVACCWSWTKKLRWTEVRTLLMCFKALSPYREDQQMKLKNSPKTQRSCPKTVYQR